MAVLGIDFGTSYTFIVKRKNKEYSVVCKSAYNASDEGLDEFAHSPGIRSVIGRDNNGNWVVGKDIKAKLGTGELREENVCWDIKTRLRRLNHYAWLEDDAKNFGFAGKYRMGMKLITDEGQGEEVGHYFWQGKKRTLIFADELARHFFKALLKDEVERGNLKDIDAMVIGMPAAEMDSKGVDTVEYQQMLKDTVLGYINREVLKLNLPDDRIVVQKEPILAGISWWAGRDKENSARNVLLVIDIGGGTADFALVEPSENGTIVVTKSQGEVELAGSVFDEKLLQCMYDDYARREFTDADKELARNTKERLFLSKFSQKMKRMADRKHMTAWDFYKRYYDRQGRRVRITNKDGREIKIAYDENHRKGLEGDGCDYDHRNKVSVDWTTGVKFIGKEFARLYDAFIDPLKFFFDGDDVNRITHVLFVGGTSGISPLRDYICKYALNLKNTGSNIWQNGEGKPVEVSFLETESRSQITCSNAIAVGAAINAERLIKKIEAPAPTPGVEQVDEDEEDTVELGDMAEVPTLCVQLKGNGDAPDFKPNKDKFGFAKLISQAYKTKGYVEGEEFGFFGVTFDQSDVGGEFVDDNYTVRFRIVRELGRGDSEEKRRYYPHRGWFSCKLNELIWQEKTELIFFADQDRAGRRAIFVCRVNDNTVAFRDNKIVRYNYRYQNNTNIYLEPFDGFYGIGDNCKIYKLVDDGNKEYESGRAFPISKRIDEKTESVFGWEKAN